MSADEVWKEFAREVGGTYTDFTQKAKRRIHFTLDEWIVVLEQDRAGFVPTRLRARFLNLEGLDFSIRPAALLTRITLRVEGAQTARPGFSRAIGFA
jgi:hypothetical protein